MDSTHSTSVPAPDVESYCWHPHGWECASEGSVRDARTVTRGKAAENFNAWGPMVPFTDVRVWKRYVRPLSRLDIWEYAVDRWAYRNDVEDPPDHPPDDWEPDFEADPSWEFVHRSHPEAIPVWICGVKGDEPPHNPKAPR